MINIKLPVFDFEVAVSGEAVPAGNSRSKTSEYYSILAPHIPWKKSGVYVLFSGDTPLYIGRSINLNQRIMSHLLGANESTKDRAKDVTVVRGFYERDICNQEIYESYAIKIYKPILNRAKTERIRGNYKNPCI